MMEVLKNFGVGCCVLGGIAVVELVPAYFLGPPGLIVAPLAALTTILGFAIR